MTAIAPSIGDQFGELRPQAEDGLRQATDVLAEPPFNLSETEIQDRVDEAIAKLRENSGPLARGLSSGAVILGEVLTGLLDRAAADVLLPQGRRAHVGLPAALHGART